MSDAPGDNARMNITGIIFLSLMWGLIALAYHAGRKVNMIDRYTRRTSVRTP